MADWTKMFDGALELTGPVNTEQLKKVPGKRGILCLLDSTDRLIVLITAADMRRRLASRLSEPTDELRKRSTDLRSVTQKVLWKLTASHFETDFYYLELTRTISPKNYASMLSWRAPWFVHVDAEEEFPRFARTRRAGDGAGRYFGPFTSARSAERFITALQDVFDLCRDYKCLRQAPHGQLCPYGQMHRCASPCDGSISMDEYRQMIGRAAAFAEGLVYNGSSYKSLQDEMSSQMRQAAEDLRFERAAELKWRMQRLAEFQRVEYKYVGPLERFRFVVVQRSPSTKAAAVFLVSGGVIVSAGVIDYPCDKKQLAAILDKMPLDANQLQQPGETIGPLRMSLVARYLISSERRRGLILRWRSGMTVDELASAIESSAGVLRLRKPKSPKQKKKST